MTTRTELTNWFYARLVLTMLVRLVRSATSRDGWNKAQRFPIKFKQHMDQIAKLQGIAVAVARLDDSRAFTEVIPYLSRLEEFFEKPYTVDEIPALCEESRAMLYRLDAIYEKYTGRKYTNSAAHREQHVSTR